MTVQSTLARQPYTISGAGPYAIPFYFLADTDIIAIRTPVGGGNPVTLALTTNYTLTGAGDKNGGALTLVAPVNGDILTIINEPPINQLTQYPETGKFPAASHERALDKLTNVAKRIYDLASRSLRLNDGDTATSLQLPVSSPGKLIGWGPSGELVNTSPAGVGPGSITPTELDRSYQPLAAQLTTLAGMPAAQLITLASMPAARATALASSYLLTTTVETDLNNIVAPGVYNLLGTANSPLTGYWVFLEVFQYINDPVFIMQRCSAMGDSVPQQAKSFIRYRYVGSVWSAWEQVSGMVATTAEMQAGTVNTVKGMSPLLVAQAISALAPVSKILQVVHYDTGALATGTTPIPFDDTIPQNNEGDQYMSLAITPLSATSTLVIDVTYFASNSAGTDWTTGALFRDSTASAIGAMSSYDEPGLAGHPTTFSVKAPSNATTTTTFKVRIGGSTGGTINFNGQGGTRKLGGVMSSSIRITEIAP
jgi:hypothetical protein